MRNTEAIYSRSILVLFGLMLGYLARIVLGPPAIETRDQIKIKPFRPSVSKQVNDSEVQENTTTGDLQKPPAIESGLVPPINFQTTPVASHSELGHPVNLTWLGEDFEHDPSAVFHPHGEELCASGCAASRHPTAELTVSHFQQLIQEYGRGPLDETNAALEELLYFGRQTRDMLQSVGYGVLPNERAEFLFDQLKMTHARIEIRVVEEDGSIRSWLEPTLVPFDRRHVFDMKTSKLQPLVTSGTVKRVGLNHCWARL